MTKRHWQFLLAIVVSGGFLFYAMRGIEFVKLWHTIQRVNYWYIIPAIMVVPLSLACRAERWGYLLRPLLESSFKDRFHCTAIGFMVNNIFPFRLGELARAYLFGKWAHCNKAAVFATIIWERILDGFMLLPVMICMLFLPFPIPVWLQSAIGSVLLVYAIIISFVTAYVLMEQFTLRITRRLIRRLPGPVQSVADSFVAMLIGGIGVIRQPRLLVQIVIWSTGVTCLLYANIGLVVLAFFGFELHWTAGFLIFLALCFAVVVPSTPGYVGPFHAACVFALSHFGIAKSDAFAFALIMHAVNYIPNTIPGIISVISEGLSFQELKTDANKEQKHIAGISLLSD